VVDDADGEGDVEAVGKGEIIGARARDLDLRETRQIAARARKRPLVDIDSATFPPAIGHRPVAIAVHAAADIEKALALPVAG
jgi:hypothetical protein